MTSGITWAQARVVPRLSWAPLVLPRMLGNSPSAVSSVMLNGGEICRISQATRHDNDATQAPGPIPDLGGNKGQEALASGETSGSAAPAKLGASGRHDRPAKGW